MMFISSCPPHADERANSVCHWRFRSVHVHAHVCRPPGQFIKMFATYQTLFLFSATCHMTYGPFWGLNLGLFKHHPCFTQGLFSCSFCHLVQQTQTTLQNILLKFFLLVFLFFFPYFLLSAKQHRCYF